MITAKDADNISRLLKQLSRESSTENTIAFVADNGGMLQSCKIVMGLNRDGSEEVREWLNKKCAEFGVQYAWFLQEAGQILQLFHSENEREDSYGILGLSSSAGMDEVKRAYRRLSVQYHPDTAGNADGDTTEQFIRINKAYHTITNTGNLQSVDEASTSTPPSWHYGKTKRLADRINKKTLLWISGLILVSIISCVLIARIYSQVVMISTLNQNGVAFVPPAKKAQEGAPAPAMTFAEKMKIAEAREKAEQAASQEKSITAAEKPATVITQPESNVIKSEIVVLPEQDTEDVPLTKDLPHAAPAEVVVDSPKAEPAQEVSQPADPQADDISSEATVEHTAAPGEREAGKIITVAPPKETASPDPGILNSADPHENAVKSSEMASQSTARLDDLVKNPNKPRHTHAGGRPEPLKTLDSRMHGNDKNSTSVSFSEIIKLNEQQTTALKSDTIKIDTAQAPLPKDSPHAAPAEIAVDSSKTEPPQKVNQPVDPQSDDIRSEEKVEHKTAPGEREAEKIVSVVPPKETATPDPRILNSDEVHEKAAKTLVIASQGTTKLDKNSTSVSSYETIKPDEQQIPVLTSDTVKIDAARTADIKPQAQTSPKIIVSPEIETQQHIDDFLSEYCSAYGSKNLTEFMRLFAQDATENGKAISDLTNTYTNLFESTQNIALQITKLKWQESANGQIKLNGRFNIDLVYLNAEAVQGRGIIDFLLINDGGKLQVKKMTYSFDQ